MRLLVAIVLLGVLVIGSVPVMAQNSCDDPFAGQGTIRFPTRYWERTDFCLRSVVLGEILSGGPPPDGIPPIDNPTFESVDAAGAWLQPQSPVIVVELNEIARAYPLAILTWHEIVNDVLGDTPIAVTFCPLCNSSLVFNRLVDGVTLRFGVSGNLRNSDLIMWDDATQSWWQQFTGEAIVGTYTGTQLELIASQVVGFGDFAARFPAGEVLSRDTGVNRSYGSNPYSGYDSTSDPFLFEGELDTRLPPTERVLAGIVDGVAVAYPFSVLTEVGIINDTVGGRDVVALWQGGVASALDRSSIDDSRDVGTAALFVRELDGRSLTFVQADDGTIRDEQTNSTWNVFGEAVEGELAGARLQLTFAAPHFWFAWAAFRPETLVYGL